MRESITVIAVLACVFGITTAAADDRPVDHTPTLDSPTIDAYRIFGLRIPFKVSPDDSVTASFGDANVWNPTAGFPDKRNTLTQAPDVYRIYGADGVIRSGEIRVSRKVDKDAELDFALNLFMLVGGADKVDYLVSDAFIEKFHESMGMHDPFNRQINPYNQAMIEYRDHRGKEYSVHDGEMFLGTFTMGAAKYLELLRDGKTLVTLKLGGFVAVPLNELNSWVGAGVTTNFAFTRRLGESVRISAAAGGYVQDDQVVKVRDSMQFADRPYTEGYQGYISVSRDFEGGGMIATGFEFEGHSAPLSTGMTDGPKVVDSSPYRPETRIDRTFRSMTDSSHFAAFFISFRPGDPNDSVTWTIYAREDYVLFPGGAYPINGGSNNPDFQIGVKMKIPLDPPRR